MVGWQNIKNTRYYIQPTVPLQWDYQRPRTCDLQFFVWFFFLLFIELVRPSFVQYKILEISLSVSRGGRGKRTNQMFRSETHFENDFPFGFGRHYPYRRLSILFKHTFPFMEETQWKRTVADSIVTNGSMFTTVVLKEFQNHTINS